MKGLILLTLFSFISGISFSQGSTERYATPIEVPSNSDRYKIDYELVDESLYQQNPSIVSTINLNVIDYYRQPSEDLIFLDKRSGLEILIYSEERVAAGKSSSSGYEQPSKH